MQESIKAMSRTRRATNLGSDIMVYEKGGLVVLDEGGGE